MMQINDRRLLTYTSLLLLLMIFILVNVLGSVFFKNIRFDFSEQKIYTLSQGSKEILAEIKEPITIRFYFSKKLAQSYPYLISYASRVRELLTQYQRASNNNLIVNVIDTESFTEAEDQAVNYGLQGVPVDGNGNELYFGLVATNSLINKGVIPFLQPTREAYLEYDISQMLYKLIYPQAAKVALLSDLPLAGNQELYFMQVDRVTHPWVIWEQLKKTFDIQVLTKESKQIPNDVKVLMLVSTGYMTKDIAYMVDQFIMRGGYVLAFIDPRPQQNVDNITKTNNNTITNYLQVLLQSWGVTIPSKIFACSKLAKKIKYNQDGKEYITNYPIWIDFSKEYFDKNDVLTSNLEQVTLANAGIITKEQDATTTVTSLVSSDGANMLIDVAQLNNYTENPSKLIKDYAEDEQKYMLAVRISGAMQSAFAEGLNNNAQYIANVKNSNVILWANTDMLRDNFWVSAQKFLGNRLYVPISGNGSFVLNAIDNLNGSNALISIRNRGVFSRPFTTIQNLQSRSRIKFKMKEDRLMHNLELTKQKLLELEQGKKESNSIAISVKQKQEEETYRKDLVDNRRQLREVQRELNKDIEKVEVIIKLVNIVLMPLLVFLGGGIFWLYRIRTNRRICTHLLYETIN